MKKLIKKLRKLQRYHDYAKQHPDGYVEWDKDENGDVIMHGDLEGLLEKYEKRAQAQEELMERLAVFIKHMGDMKMDGGHAMNRTGHFQMLSEKFKKWENEK